MTERLFSRIHAALLHVRASDRNLGWLAGAALVLAVPALLEAQGPEVITAGHLEDKALTLTLEVSPGGGFAKGSIRDFHRIGDFNGDGFDDVAMGVNEQGAASGYAVVVYGLGGTTGRYPLDAIAGEAGTLAIRSPTFAYLQISPAGDLDGDTLADFFLGAPSGPSGTAILIHGAPDLEGTFSFEDVRNGALRVTVFETANPIVQSLDVSAINCGDFNGDGELDLALGARGSSPEGRENAGIVFLLYQSRNLPPAIDPDTVGTTLPGTKVFGRERRSPPPSTRVGDWIGTHLKALGDINGDGFADIAVSNEAYLDRAVFLLLGSASPPPLIDLQELELGRPVEGVVVLQGRSSVLSFGGESVAGIGDLDGDGIAEIALGLSRSGTTFPDPPRESRVHLIFGRRDFPSRLDFGALPPDLGVTIHGPDLGFFGDGFGANLEAGDVNGDGVQDLFIGSPNADLGGIEDVGEAYIVFGKWSFERDLFVADGFDGIRITGELNRHRLGATVGPAGDFDGDGSMDIRVLETYQGLPSGTHKAHVIYGRGSVPAPLTLLDIAPAVGSIRGGTRVLLRGTGFRGSPRVLFGGKVAENVVVLTAFELEAFTPPGASLGAVDVTVTVDTETRRLDRAFEYTLPFPTIDLDTLGAGGLVLEGGPEATLGEAITLGDLDGDGVAELVLDYWSAITPATWKVFIVHGDANLAERLGVLDPSPYLTVLSSLQAVPNQGLSVTVLGDVNGDRRGDLGIGMGYGVGYILLGREELPAALDLDAEVLVGGAVRLTRSGIELLRPFSFAPLGDVNGDGFDNFAVAVPQAPRLPGAPPTDAGGEILFLDGAAVWPETLELGTRAYSRVHGEREGQELGHRLAAAGDIDGDGLVDLLVTDVARNPTVVYLLHGSREMPSEVSLTTYLLEGPGGTKLVLPRGAIGEQGLLHLAPAGDTNGDGFGDFLLGDEWAELGKGMAYLVRGGPRFPDSVEVLSDPAQPDGIVRIAGAGTQTQAGRVGPAGDFNRDGLGDVLVAEYGLSPLQPMSFYLLLGNPDLPVRIDLARLTNGTRIMGQKTLMRPGLLRQAPGDMNGDAVGDLVLAESGNAGAVYVVFGPSPSFIRGDANRDGAVDVSDGIFILSYLFLGDHFPRCQDALDVDDTGIPEITDAIYLLTHLFIGGPAPPPPHPGVGLDPSFDALDCKGI